MHYTRYTWVCGNYSIWLTDTWFGCIFFSSHSLMEVSLWVKILDLFLAERPVLWEMKRLVIVWISSCPRMSPVHWVPTRWCLPQSSRIFLVQCSFFFSAKIPSTIRSCLGGSALRATNIVCFRPQATLHCYGGFSIFLIYAQVFPHQLFFCVDKPFFCLYFAYLVGIFKYVILLSATHQTQHIVV